MLPMICNDCQTKIPGHNGLFHARDFLTPCPICGGKGRPASVIHLAIECDVSEAHPDLKGESKLLGVKSKPEKIACGYGPSLPKSLTNLPQAATCFHCLKVYRQITSPPVETESQS